MAEPPAADAAIRFDHVEKRFPGSARPAVGDLSLTVPAGELVAFVGPSGCGKTTSLRMVNRLEEPTGGSIEVGGADVRRVPPHELRRGIGYVIQQTGLFPHRTIAANIGTVPQLLGWDRDRIEARVDELVDLVGLDPELLGRHPAALSGGQQQRVGVARALAADPPILLMDEPYSAVDPIVRNRLQDELLDLQRRLRKTVVLVTHDIDEAIKLADRIALLNIGGVLEQYAPPAELLRTPANEFVESFLGRERALRRMALLTVADAAPTDGPVVQAEDPVEVARRVMAEHHVDWVGVLRGRRLEGWVGAEELDGHTTMADLEPKRFVAWVAPTTPLREALDTIVDSRTRVAVVLDGEYRGMVTVQGIADAMGALMDRKRKLLDWQWVQDHLDEVWANTLEHLRLTVIAVGVGFAIASLLAIVALRWRWTYAPITWVTGVIYTIPSLALFVLLVPVFGIGSTMTAEVALVGYTLLILVRNIVAGIDGVPDSVRDAADGMGYTRTRRLLHVELPLAVPTVIAGLRIATVTTIGLVTVTALVGLGGYGAFINEGLDRSFVTEITLGGGLSVVMAVAFDLALVALGRALTPWLRGARRRKTRRQQVLEANATRSSAWAGQA